MLNSITRTMLTTTMSFAWSTIKTGERIVAYTMGWNWGSTDEHAGFAERFVRTTGKTITAIGERIDLATNGLAMQLGYRDGEVYNWVTCPALAH